MGLLKQRDLLERVLKHVEGATTDLSHEVWREPVVNYTSPERLKAEIEQIFRQTPCVFAPAAALPQNGSYMARDVTGMPVIAVRGNDGVVRAFKNSCRHRGAALAEGTGCKKTIVCPYHAWTYSLDGRLRGIPDEHGFPGVKKEDHGLVPVAAFEKYGLIFVNVEGTDGPSEVLDEMGEIIGPKFEVISHTERTVHANWKLIAEGFLEGYHIKHTHPETFFPRQYDNLNIIEAFGPNNRITYPFRVIEKLKAKPVETWNPREVVTNVYHLFPNCMISIHPASIGISVFEPLAPDNTRVISFMVSDVMDTEQGRYVVGKAKELIVAAKAEDRFVVSANQKGIRSGANTHLTFGLFEGALLHFHKTLSERLT